MLVDRAVTSNALTAGRTGLPSLLAAAEDMQVDTELQSRAVAAAVIQMAGRHSPNGVKK